MILINQTTDFKQRDSGPISLLGNQKMQKTELYEVFYYCLEQVFAYTYFSY